MAAHSGASCGTVEETIDASSAFMSIPRRSSSARSAAPSSSAVDSRTVAKRQCWTRSVPRKVPKCVCVFPTSTTNNMRQDARMPRGEVTLYVVPASHPCAAVELALQRQGLAYERVDLLPVFHLVHQRLAFDRRTAPGLKLPDGGRVSGSRAIMRVLEALEPARPLLPAAPPHRAKGGGA